MDDFERRRELRRQKREEMRLEAERIAYQRNDDDEEEAARERRRRARQERLRQKQEEDSLGQVTTDQVEVNAQNSVSNEEVKTTSTHTSVLEGDDEAAFQERLARREERRQKRLQEALERQKELDPTITDGGSSLLSRRATNSTADADGAEKEEKRESRQERYELDGAGSKSYQKNDWRDAEAPKKEGKEKEEEEEEEEAKPKPGSMEDNQVEVTAGEKPAESQEETGGMSLNNGQVSAEEPGAEAEVTGSAKVEEEERERAQAERVRLEAEERERIKAEQEQKLAEEKARLEAEEKAAAQEREKREAEERKRREEEERKRREEEERKRREEEERKAAEERQRIQAEEAEKAKKEEQKRQQQLEEKRRERQEEKINGEKVDAKKEGKWVNEKKATEDKLPTAAPKKQGEEKGAKVPAKREQSQEDKPSYKKEEVKDEKMKKDKEPKGEVKSFLDGKKGFTEVKSQNGEFMTHKLKPTENTFSRPGGARASEVKEAEEAGKRLEELRRRRGETESEEFEKLKQKQQEAALELEELKKKREERRKVLEEEEQRRKQEEAERKAREEEEKRRLKEEIGRRRAEAAEKRQKMPDDASSDDKKPFKCFTPKGSSLKIEERAEFLNKSVQKSGVKSTHQAAVVSKIDSRLEQYTSAIEGTKSAKPTKSAASDLPVPAEGVRNIKSMWEKGNVFSSPSASGTPNKETAGLKVGVSSRINEWLTKTPDGNKSPAPKPSDLRPGDVSGKRNLWEKQSMDKVTSPAKV
ncbi:caldesmon isoform X2 [Sorex araneus]|uniref:caldesmon isoform X2 n=1 Tax=Sorex araneus TaxID=42254 RepID=UPI00243338DA|nr:caldesmon isoform X2 [Sorex araneus]